MAKVRIDNRRAERRIERKHEAKIERILRAGYTAGLRAYLEKRPVLPAIHNAHAKLESELIEIYTEAFLASGVSTFNRVKRSVGKKQAPRFQDLPVDLPPELRRGLMEFIARESGRKITQMDRTTQDRIAQAVQRAIEEGTPIDTDDPAPSEPGLFDPKTLSEQIREIARIDSRYRAHMIARTETHSASQAATIVAAEATGLVKEKEWVSADDPRTREAHQNIDNVPMGQPFIVDGEELDYPGDPRGSAGNIINCRCQVVFVV